MIATLLLAATIIATPKMTPVPQIRQSLPSPVASPVPRFPGPPNVTTGQVGVLNGVLTPSAVTTVLPGVGSGYLYYTLTNESTTNGIRCMYGGIAGQAPPTPPSASVGTWIAPAVTLAEHTAPSNRLDCIAVGGNVAVDVTLYPK
jgi:hypothetical protein